MKSKVLLVLLFALLLFGSHCQAQQIKAAPITNSILWRVSGKGLPKASYILGTIDFICPGDYLWTKSMKDCFANSEKVCFSLNLTDKFAKEMTPAFINNGGKQLGDYFTTAEYETVKHFAHDSMHIDLDRFEAQSLKPLAVQQYLIKQLLGCPDAVSYELRLLADAKKEGKQVLGIETANEFINEIEATHFNDKVAAVLIEMAGGSTYYKNYRHDLEQAYQQQDLQRINTIFKGAKLFSKADLSIFLDEKNKRWIDRAPSMMQQSSVFFAVNPINLGGAEGIISLLKKAGYTVEPIH